MQNAETITLNQEPSPISELIQQQTDTIKKILSASSTTNKKTSNKNCEDIENGLKESLENPKVEEMVQFQNSPSSSTQGSITVQPEIERGGDVVTISNEERNVDQLRINMANGRNFNLNKNNDPVTNAENQNYILIPCIKKLVSNDGTQKVTYEEVSDNPNIYQEKTALNAEPSTQNLNNVSNQNAYVLEKVYSPSGYFLYYIYRLRNSNPFPTDYTTPYIAPSTSTSTTTTSTTTETPTPTQQQDPVYQEQLKFVIQMPYIEPDIGLPPQRKFDQYSYYPQEFQPSYMNAPMVYQPSYHMIRTLVIPNEYSNLAQVDNNSNKGNYDNLSTQ